MFVRRVDGKPALYVEGQHITDLSRGLGDPVADMGCDIFVFFCQKLNFNAIKNTAPFLAVYIIRSDSCARLSKDLQAVIAKLM